MANISQIKLPNGTTYNLVDKTSGYTTNTGTITGIKTTNGAHSAINVTSGVATFNIPTKTSHLTNDSGFLTSHLTGTGAIGVENGEIKIVAQTAMTGGTEEYIYSITNHTVQGISGFLVLCDDGSGDGMMKFFPDMEGVSTASQAIINQIPTKTSDLTNDSGFLTTETDPTVPSWAKASTKPTYTASEVGALASNTTYVSKITTTAGAHTAISNKSGAVSFNVPTTAAHVGIKFGYTTSGNNRAVLQDSSGNLYVTQKDDNTTYSAGTGLSLSSGSFSVKTGYTTSGNNRAVQADSNGNLYVVQTDNNTTYSAGTGLSLSSTTFSVKLGYTTSGNNRAVQADTNGNLYVVQKDDNTTYSSKAAASGGTDVSLVTTGEKYTWNSKTSNTGTVTSVAASGSGGITISGSPITSSGTITIGLNLSTAINGLSEGSSPATINDYAVVQYAGGGTTTTTYHRRKLSNLIVGKAVNDQNGLRIDTGYLKLTGGSVTGPVSFGDSVSIDDLNAGQLVVSGSASVVNNLQVNTINGVAVGSNPKFTDNNTTYSSKAAASGGTDVSLVTTGEKYTWNSKTSNTGTITSVKTTAGTHTTINTTSGAVSFNVPTKTSHLTNDSGYVTSSGVTSITLKAGSGISLDTDNTAITTTGTRTISHADTSSQASSSNSGRTYIQSLTLDSYGHVTGISTATESVTNTDTKLQVAGVTSGTQYYPIVGTGTSARTRQYDTTGFKYKGTNGTTSAVGSAILELGNSTASGTANNKQAQLIMYGSNAKKATITLAAPSADVALALPTSGGMLALTSQIPSISVTQKTATGTNIADVTVNGTTTQLFAPNGGGEHRELTQAEYDALSQSEKKNGTIYFITDSNPIPPSLIDLFYPVGSYYETSNSNFDPNNAWGGTWVLEAGGKVHIGAGTNYTIGATGGEATHTLTVDEIPSHTHALPHVMGYVNSTGGGNGTYGAVNTWTNVGNTGGGKAHNNMPPYIVVNRWHRTA